MGSPKLTQAGTLTEFGLFSSLQPPGHPQAGGFFIDPDQISVYHDAGVCRLGVAKTLESPQPLAALLHTPKRHTSTPLHSKYICKMPQSLVAFSLMTD